MSSLESRTTTVLAVTFSLLILTINASVAGVVPPPVFSGDYAFQGRIESLATVDTQNVYTQFEEGQARLDELDRQGYACFSHGSYWWTCTRLRPDLTLPPALVRHFQSTYQNKLRLHFGPLQGSPVLLHSNGDTEVWRVWQRAELDKTSYGEFKNLQLGSVSKLIFGGTEELVRQTTPSGLPCFGYVESISQEAADGVSFVRYHIFLELDPVLSNPPIPFIP